MCFACRRSTILRPAELLITIIFRWPYFARNIALTYRSGEPVLAETIRRLAPT